jgi:nucleoside 2-deoxyribosyltransferase
MRPYLVYLAGPITGLGYSQAADWRDHADTVLKEASGGRIVGVSPMRMKPGLRSEESIKDDYKGTLFSNQQSVFARDRFDCRRADLVLVNVLGARKPSIGTCMEIAWADAFGVPVVIAMEEEGNPHDHAMVRVACGFRVTSLDEALRVAVGILLP